MNLLIKFIKGFIIGACGVAPGVSGGSLAVIFGLYEKISEALSGLLKNFKSNVIFFWPVILGAIVGVLLASDVIRYLFSNYNFQMRYLFIGLMAGTLPSVARHANKYGFKKIYVVPFVITLVLSVIPVFFQYTSDTAQSQLGFDSLLVYGVIIGVGTIVPGISASFILVFLGVYEPILGAIADINIPALIPLGIGAVVAVLALARVINYLYKRAFGLTSYAILGFVVGSLVLIFPGVSLNATGFISILLCLAGVIITFMLCRIDSRTTNDKRAGGTSA